MALFTLNRLGLNASGNAIVFVFVGVIVVAVQGGFIGPWSRRFGDRRLVYVGLAPLALGLSLTALTPRQPMPSYSREKIGRRAEPPAAISARTRTPPRAAWQSRSCRIRIRAGWVSSGCWSAMIPASIGGGILQPSINSLITKRIERDEVGGMLGISAAFLSGANAIAPLLGGAVFQAFGSTAPFLLGGLLMAVLLLFAVRGIQPGREEAPRTAPAS